MGFKLHFLFTLWLLLQPLAALAWPPEVAPELNFTNSEMEQAWRRQADSSDTVNPTSFDYQERFMKSVKGKCDACEITEMVDRYGVKKYRVTLKNGWHFDITLDPSVIEITAKPVAVNEIAAIKEEIEAPIFSTAKELSLRTDTAGHLNYGIESTFGDDSRLFYNFIADYLNNPGLTRGVMGYEDNANAPHPEKLAPKQRAALKNVLDDFDPEKSSATDLAKSLYKEVYYRSVVFGGADGEPPEKYHAVNIVSLTKEGDTWPRLELRAVQMQKSAEEVELLSKLFASRVEFLKRKSGKISYIGDKNYQAATPEEMIEDFHRYVVESGLEWKSYRPFISKERRFAYALAVFDKKLMQASNGVASSRASVSLNLK
jgi:hypothetical protein